MKSRRGYVLLLSTALALVVLLAISSGASGAARRPSPGLVYGGTTSQGAPVWLRLRADRQAISFLEFPWRAARSQCSNGQPMVMPENFDAAHGFRPIKLHDGRFDATIPERVGTPDGTGTERFTLAGTVTDAAVHATFSASVHVNAAAGGSYDCTLGRTTFAAVN